MGIDNIDRTLLRCFDALIALGSVSQAAEKIGVSQPTMSNALARLRELFGDPLLIRARGTMAPTPRALELVEPVRTMLEQFDRILSKASLFDPATSRARFTISAPNYVEFTLLPRLVGLLQAEAPFIDVDIRPSDPERVVGWLERGEVDFRIGWVRHPPASARSKVLFRDRFACLVRRDHPVIGARLTLDQYMSLPQVRTRTSSRSEYWRAVSEACAVHGGQPRVAFVAQDFLVVPAMVAATDLIATVPERIAIKFADQFDVRALRPPLAIAPITISAYWHERTHNEPAHRWFRKALSQIASEL